MHWERRVILTYGSEIGVHADIGQGLHVDSTGALGVVSWTRSG